MLLFTIVHVQSVEKCLYSIVEIVPRTTHCGTNVSELSRDTGGKVVLKAA